MKRHLLFILCGLVLAGCGELVLKFYNDGNSDDDGDPLCQIIYTSTGSIVEPYNKDFGANIKSNKIDGNQGVIKFRGPVTKIGDSAFYKCDNLTGIIIPNSATKIDSYAFYYCENLTSVTIPDSVKEIGSSAFSNCTELASITIPDSVEEIGSSALYNCSRLTSATIGNGVTSIGNYAFSRCTSLTSVTIGNGVTSIGYEAFYGCSRLTSFYCKASNPPMVNDFIFSHNNMKIYVPRASVNKYKAAYGWSDYEDIIVGYDF